jgi:hypothetical protein
MSNRALSAQPSNQMHCSALKRRISVSHQSGWQDHQAIYGFDPKETALGCAFQWKKPGIRSVFPRWLPKED